MRRFGLTCIIGLAACGGDPIGTADPDAAPISDGSPASRCVQTPSAPDDPHVVVTEAGEVRGMPAGAATAFLGIPYAAPPVGERRFRAPEPHTCWEGVREATSYGRVCPQMLPSGSRFGDEDCLFANVWTPEARATTRRPVLVFIHGGAYEFGSGNQDLVLEGSGNLYDGRTLASEHDAVIVTINYRLGSLGFMAHPALSAEDPHGSSGNYGTLDQIAALRWVQGNIAAFGGDPDRVMIFGESAGGLSTCLLLATPLARGLFHAAIVESGGCQVATQATRFEQGANIAADVGCDDAADPVACLRAAPASKFVVAFGKDGFAGPEPSRMWEMMHGPNIDGHVFVEPPLVTLREGRHAKVPVVFGSNSDEFEIFLPPMGLCSDYYAFVGVTFGARADEVIAKYSCFAFATPRDAAVAVMTDHMFTCEARRMARAAQAGGSAVRRYFFTRAYTNHALGALDAFHVAELPFVFRTFDVLSYPPTAADLELSRHIGGYWARLAATGDPDGPGAPAWPLYDAAADTALRLDMPLETVTGVRSARCDFWDTFAN